MRRLRKLLLPAVFFLLINNYYAEPEKAAEKPIEPVQTPAAETKAAGEPTQTTAPNSTAQNATPVAEPPRVIQNPAILKAVTEQFQWTPEDPSFLYETRNIPDHKDKEEFLPAELEKVVITEQIKEERDFRKSLDKIKIRLPDMTQTLVIVGILIILFFYRSRARKAHEQRRQKL